MAPEEQAVRTICGYLIKCNQYGDVYFSWFQKGIAQHLKIAGLYEAYILSWNKANGMLPNEVLHYFFQKQLPSGKTGKPCCMHTW